MICMFPFCMVKNDDMNKPHEAGLPEAVSFGKFLELTTQPLVELPPIAAHPYDTSREVPLQEPFGPDVIDVRTLNQKDGVDQTKLPPGSLIRGTFSLWLPDPTKMVMAQAVTDKWLPTRYNRSGQRSELIAQMPILADEDDVPYAEFQRIASRWGLLRFIADVRVEEDVVAPLWHGYSIRSVYAMEYPHDSGPQTVPLDQSVVLEGYVSRYHEQYGQHSDEPRPHLALATTHGAETVLLQPLDRLPFGGVSDKANYESPNPNFPLIGDLVQIRCYPSDSETYRVGADKTAGTRELRSLKVLHLLETGSERWEQSHRRTSQFEQAIHQMKTAETDAEFRHHYGAFLLSRIDMTQYENLYAMDMTEAERQKLDAIYRGRVDPEHPPIGATVNNRRALNVYQKYNFNVFAATKEEWESLVRKVIAGEQKPLIHDGFGSPVPDITSEAHPGFLPEASEKTLTLLLPRVLARAQYGETISSHDMTLIQSALHFAVRYDTSRPHIPYVIMDAMSQIFDTTLPSSLPLFHLRMAVSDQLAWLLRSCCSFSRHRQDTTLVENVQSVANPELAKTIVAWMPPLLEFCTTYVSAKQREYDALPAGFARLEWGKPPAAFQGNIDWARERLQRLQRHLLDKRA